MRAYGIILMLFSCSVLPAQDRNDGTIPAKRDSLAVPGHQGWYSLSSNPEGAEVYQDTTFVGRTPLVRCPAREGGQIFRLFFPDARHWDAVVKTDSLTIPEHQEVSSVVNLDVPSGFGIIRQHPPTTETDPDLFLASTVKGNSRTWIGYVAGATMIVSGVLSAYLKTKSDNDFDTYVATGDPNLLSTTQRLDRLAGASLFVTELSLGVLMYLLLSD